MNEQPAKKRSSILSFLEKLWRRFPSACTLCILLFLLFCITQLKWLLTLSEGDFSVWPDFLLPASTLLPGILLGALGSLLLRRYRWPAWIHWLTALAGCLLGYFFHDHATLYFGLLIAAVLLFVHFALDTEHREERFGQIAGSFFSCAGLTFCLTLLLTLCISALTTLLFKNFWKLAYFLRTASSTFSLTIAAPFLFLGRLPDNDTPPEKRNAFRKFTVYLLLPAFLLLTGILLIYIITIIIQWEMPVGQMNWFALAALSFFTLLRLTLTGEEYPISRWFCRWGALLLAPVIIAQQVGVWIRVDAYGLTPARYIGLAITLLLIAVVALSFFGKPTRWFFAAAAALTLLLTMTPLNADNVSRWNQEIRLKTALTESGMLETGGRIIPNPDADIEQKRIILSSAEYLGYHVDNPPKGSFTEKFLTQFPSSGIIDGYELVFGFSYNSVSEKNREEKTVRGLCDQDSVDIAGFSHAQWFEFSYRFETMSPSDDNAKAFFVPEDAMACVDWDTKTLLRSDIPLEEGKVFRISQLRLISYDGEPDRLYVKGWLLTP